MTARSVAGRLARRLRRWAFAAYRQQIGTSSALDVQPPVAVSVKEWCDQHTGFACEVIAPAQTTSREPPRTIEQNVDERFFNIAGSKYTVPEKYLAVIPHGRMIGDTGLVVLPDGAFASETTFGEQHLVKRSAYTNALPGKARKKRGNYFSLMSLWAHQPNYYHWIHDAILRCHLVLPHLPRDTKFIVPPKLRPFQYDSLDLLGIQKAQLRGFSGEELWDLENLYFAAPTASSGSNSPAALQWLRELAWERYGLPPSPARRRIYISRQNTQYRRIVNEAELEPVLRDYGFETFRFEELSFHEQVILMSQAEVVASASGAALTNILFAPPGAKVLVMVEPIQISVFFWTMAEAAGHEYWYAVGETVPGIAPPHDADLSMPPATLARTLAAMQL